MVNSNQLNMHHLVFVSINHIKHTLHPVFVSINHIKHTFWEFLVKLNDLSVGIGDGVDEFCDEFASEFGDEFAFTLNDISGGPVGVINCSILLSSSLSCNYYCLQINAFIIV